MKELYDLKDRLCDTLKEYGRKGELSAGALDIVDKLAHTVKNLDKIIGAYESEYSNHGLDDAKVYSMNRGFYRESSARKRDDDLGYDSHGYSRGNFTAKLRELMNDAPDDHTRTEIHRLIEKMDDNRA